MTEEQYLAVERAAESKKALRPLLGYLSEQGLGYLLAQIDRLAKRGERDYVLLSNGNAGKDPDCRALQPRQRTRRETVMCS